MSTGNILCHENQHLKVSVHEHLTSTRSYSAYAGLEILHFELSILYAAVVPQCPIRFIRESTVLTVLTELFANSRQQVGPSSHFPVSTNEKSFPDSMPCQVLDSAALTLPRVRPISGVLILGGCGCELGRGAGMKFRSMHPRRSQFPTAGNSSDGFCPQFRLEELKRVWNERKSGP